MTAWNVRGADMQVSGLHSAFCTVGNHHILIHLPDGDIIALTKATMKALAHRSSKATHVV